MFVLKVVHWIISQIRFLILSFLPSVFYGYLIYSLGNLFHNLTNYGGATFIVWYAIASGCLWLWIDRKRIKSIIIKTYTMNSKLVLTLIVAYWAAEKKVLSDDKAKEIAIYGDSLIRNGANEGMFVKEVSGALGVDPIKTSGKLVGHYKFATTATPATPASPPNPVPPFAKDTDADKPSSSISGDSEKKN